MMKEENMSDKEILESIYRFRQIMLGRIRKERSDGHVIQI